MQFKIRKLSHLSLHPDFRWDSQYLSCEPYKNKSFKYIPIGDTLTSSQYGVSIEMNEDNIGTKIYRMNEISNMLCDRNILKYAELSDSQIAAFKLKDRDVLFNRTNSKEFVGRTGIFRKFSDEDIVFASYLVRVNPDPEIVTPEYLTAFLNTKYGVIDIKRRARHSVNQSNVNLEEVKRIEIPLLCNQLQREITLSFNKAFDLLQASDAALRQAQLLFLDELGLADWQPKHQLTFVKNFSDTKSAERIDAGYFQPRYDEIVDAIKNYSGGSDTLGNLCSTKRGSLIKDSFYDEKEGKPYIRGGDFSGGLLTKDKLVFINSEFKHTNETRVYENDIVFSLIGSVGETALVTSEFSGAFISNNTGKIECNASIFSVTLQVLLASVIGELYFEKYKTQTAQPKISDKDLHNFVIPILTEEKQIQIQQKVNESFNLRNRAKDLLEHAKRAVEIAIEQDEQAAINWLESVSVSESSISG